MGLKINLDNRTEFVPNLIATSKVQPDCQDPVATGSRFCICVAARYLYNPSCSLMVFTISAGGKETSIAKFPCGSSRISNWLSNNFGFM